jgi:hypothetical protein
VNIQEWSALASECGGGFLHLLGLCCGFIKANLKIETVITAPTDREVHHCRLISQSVKRTPQTGACISGIAASVTTLTNQCQRHADIWDLYGRHW